MPALPGGTDAAGTGLAPRGGEDCLVLAGCKGAAPRPGAEAEGGPPEAAEEGAAEFLWLEGRRCAAVGPLADGRVLLAPRPSGLPT